MTNTAHELLTRAYERIAHWLTADTDDLDDVDEAYVTRSDQFTQYWYVDVVEREDTDGLRCNLCGKLFPVADAPAAFEHVGEHDGVGQATVDPFAQGPEWQLVDRDDDRGRRPRTSMGESEHKGATSQNGGFTDETYEWLREENMTAGDLRNIDDGESLGPPVFTEQDIQAFDDARLPEGFYGEGGEN